MTTEKRSNIERRRGDQAQIAEIQAMFSERNRLRDINAELLEALETVRAWASKYRPPSGPDTKEMLASVNAALAKPKDNEHERN